MLNAEMYFGDLIAVDMETGTFGLCYSCQFLIHTNNLSPFEVGQLAENLGHMKLQLF